MALDKIWQPTPQFQLAKGRGNAQAQGAGDQLDQAGQQQYGAEPGQLGHYWSEASYGRIDLAGSTAHGWYTLPSPRSTYVTKVDGKDKADLNKLFADCASAAPDTVDLNAPVGINMMFNGDLDGFAWGGQSCATVRGALDLLAFCAPGPTHYKRPPAERPEPVPQRSAE